MYHFTMAGIRVALWIATVVLTTRLVRGQDVHLDYGPIALDRTQLSSECISLVPSGAAAVPADEMLALFEEISRLDLHYETINDCCMIRTFQIARYVATKGYHASMIWNTAGGIVEYRNLKAQGLSESEIQSRMGGRYLRRTTIFPEIPALYAWFSDFTGWFFHVAPIVPVRQRDGRTCDMVFDAALFREPVSVARWIEFQRDATSLVQVTSAKYYCTPTQTRASCSVTEPNVAEAFADCTDNPQRRTWKQQLVGQWKEADGRHVFELSSAGEIRVTDGGRNLVRGKVAYSTGELELLVDASELLPPFAQDPVATAGSVLLRFQTQRVGDVEFLALWPMGREDHQIIFERAALAQRLWRKRRK